MLNSSDPDRPRNSDSDYGVVKNLVKEHFTDEELKENSIFGLLDLQFKRREQKYRERFSHHDKPELVKLKSEKYQYYEDRSSSTWQQRLKYMWSYDEWGGVSPELMFVTQATWTSFIAASIFGAWHESNKIYRIFLEQNKYTMFQHPREAQRALQDRIVLAMMQVILTLLYCNIL